MLPLKSSVSSFFSSRLSTTEPHLFPDQAVGDAGKTQYDKDDVLRTFNSFRNVAKPIPFEVLLRHYNTIDPDVPSSINMNPEVFDRICSAFTSARFVLFLIGVVPGTRSVRLERRNKITKLISEIHAKRLEFETKAAALRSSLEELNTMRDMLMSRLRRQDLVMEVHAITYDDMKRYEKEVVRVL